MISTLMQMAALICCGVIWRLLTPAGLTAAETRTVLTSVVYYLFLPALIILVLGRAELGLQSLQFSLLGVSCILFAAAVIWLTGKVFRLEDTRLGAVMLAAAFPNVTYLGLPVLEETYGSWARSVAIQLDLFAGSPLLFTLGIMIAVHYGRGYKNDRRTILQLLNAPLFWAAAVALLLNIYHMDIPETALGVLKRLADAVVPLMLFSLGLALDWKAVKLRNMPYIFPVILVKLLLMPLFALLLISFLNIEGAYKSAAILEMAMPSMVLGLVFCDRYGLDTSLYTMAVTVTTLLSLFSLPFWYQIAT